MFNFKKYLKILSLSLLSISLQANPYEIFKNLLLTNEGVKQILKERYHNHIDINTIYPSDITQIKFNTILKQQLTQALQQEAVNPICFLLECYTEDCELTRTHQNEYTRHILENRILEYIKNKYPDKNQNIAITDFGSGGLLQNLIIVTRILNEGYKNLTICLIDKGYRNYILHKLDRNYLKKLLQENDLIAIHFTIFDSHMFRQYKSFLNKNFPDSKIYIKIFHNINGYLKTAIENPNFKTDIFLSIDTIVNNNFDDDDEDEYNNDNIEKTVKDLIKFYLSPSLKINGLVFLCFDGSNIDIEKINNSEKGNVITVLRKEYEIPEKDIHLPNYLECLPILMHVPYKPNFLSNYQVLENYIFYEESRFLPTFFNQ